MCPLMDLKCFNRIDLVKLQINYKSLNSLYDLVVSDTHKVRVANFRWLDSWTLSDNSVKVDDSTAAEFDQSKYQVLGAT